MRLPVLNRKLVLEAPDRTSDGAGGYTIVWAPLGEVWADVRPGSGRESEVHSLPRSQVSLTVFLRAAPVGASSRPVAGQRFRDGARIFNITAVTETGASRHYLQCRVQEEVAT